MSRRLPDATYARLLALRTGLRRFENWSAEQAKAAGLTPAHHQLLLAIRGHGDDQGPTIGEVADYLLLRHHSAVGLVDRAEAAGLVRRLRSDDDQRVVRLQLTEKGALRLESLSALHLEEVHRLGLTLSSLTEDLGGGGPMSGIRVDLPQTGAAVSESAVGLARIYERSDRGATRVLVDRLWPRGIPRNGAPFDQWSKEVAPSSELRKWYAHDSERFREFALRYVDELSRSPAKEALESLRATASSKRVVLVTATKDLDHSAAAVLREVLSN